MHQHPVRVRGAQCAVAVLLAVALVVAPRPADAQAAAGRDAFTAEAEVQRVLLEQDVDDYRAARRAEDRARAALEEALAGYDQAIRPRRLALVDVEAAGDAVATARARLGVAAAESARLSAAIHDRLRALAVLDGRAPAEAAAVPPGGLDLTGRWRVAVAPQGLLGTFHLDQDGAVVTGTYTLTDGSGGSLRGSISGDQLRLERIDRTSGFDSIYYATVDAAAERIDGTWAPTILSSGGPGGGTWSAVPAGSAAAEDLEPASPGAGDVEEEDLGDETVLDAEDLDEDGIEDGALEDDTPPDEEIP